MATEYQERFAILTKNIYNFFIIVLQKVSLHVFALLMQFRFIIPEECAPAVSVANTAAATPHLDDQTATEPVHALTKPHWYGEWTSLSAVHAPTKPHINTATEPLGLLYMPWPNPINKHARVGLWRKARISVIQQDCKSTTNTKDIIDIICN